MCTQCPVCPCACCTVKCFLLRECLPLSLPTTCRGRGDGPILGLSFGVRKNHEKECLGGIAKAAVEGNECLRNGVFNDSDRGRPRDRRKLLEYFIHTDSDTTVSAGVDRILQGIYTERDARDDAQPNHTQRACGERVQAGRYTPRKKSEKHGAYRIRTRCPTPPHTEQTRFQADRTRCT